MREAALSMVKANSDCVKVLYDCLKMVSKDPIEAINLANKVELLRGGHRRTL
jgi:hypothetical protein